MKSKWCKPDRNEHGWCMNRDPTECHCSCTCHIVRALGKAFPSFGGGQTSNYNPIVQALKDQPLMFAAGVDIAKVVDYVTGYIEGRKPRKRKK